LKSGWGSRRSGHAPEVVPCAFAWLEIEIEGLREM